MVSLYTVRAVRNDDGETQEANCRTFAFSQRGDERTLTLFGNGETSERKTLYLDAYKTVDICKGPKRFWTWDGRHARYV